MMVARKQNKHQLQNRCNDLLVLWFGGARRARILSEGDNAACACKQQQQQHLPMMPLTHKQSNSNSCIIFNFTFCALGAFARSKDRSRDDSQHKTACCPPLLPLDKANHCIVKSDFSLFHLCLFERRNSVGLFCQSKLFHTFAVVFTRLGAHYENCFFLQLIYIYMR
jgi:hypothetical protein